MTDDPGSEGSGRGGDLFAAIGRGDRAAVARLLAAAPELAVARDAAGVSATLHALYHGQADLAEAVAADVAALDIFEAAALGRVDRVRVLLGTEPSLARAFSADGFTALHYPGFFGRGDALGSARALLDAGAEVNAVSRNDFSVMPLHSAVAGGHRDVVWALIAAGADVNATQLHGFRPLHGAAQNGDDETVDRLLTAGTDPEATNDAGRTAADLADEAGHAELAARLRRS